jgi:hypothetical protein
MPSITVRSFAEMLQLPAYEQVRVLREQKYPGDAPQVFRLPYYQAALRGIRSYHRTGNNQGALTAALSIARALRPDHRRRHNLRVLTAFGQSTQRARQIVVAPAQKWLAFPVKKVELRLQFDLQGSENSDPRLIFYNCRQVPLNREVALKALEIAAWVLGEAGAALPPTVLEYVDLSSGQTYRINRIRTKTIRAMRDNANVIEALWPTV